MRPVARVISRDDKPGVLGLKNETNDRWIARTKDGKRLVVSPGRAFVLEAGSEIDFGSSVCKIVS